MDRFCRSVDAVSGLAGALARVAAMVSVTVCFATVYMRYALDMTWIWLNESYLWANAFAIVLGAGWTWRDGALVRVDIFYERLSARGRGAVDAFGILFFLAPFLWIVFVHALPFVATSWRMGESSAQPSGMPAIWLLKGSLLALVALLALQALAELARALAAVVTGQGR